MTNWYGPIVLFHVATGTVALLLFWSAAISRKGSNIHRRIGRWYLLAMAGVVITGIPMTWEVLSRGHIVSGTFLAYLVVLVSHGCLTAWRAIRHRQNFARFAGPLLVGGGAVLTATGLVTVLVGLNHGAVLLVAFGAIGPITGWGVWRLVKNGPDAPDWWVREHFGAMIGNGIATHIAFLNIGLTRAFPTLNIGTLQLLAWMLPLATGFAAAWWLSRRYRLRREAVAGRGSQSVAVAPGKYGNEGG